jgi:molybdate transport system substrate-binding protein
MLYFFPLCFSKYVLITPKGNPGHIGDIHDMARPGVRTVLSPGASPPGGESSTAILQKAGVLEGARENAVVSGDCVQRILPSIASGEGDVAIVENRLTVKHGYEDKFDVLPIAEQYIPPKPIPFTIGLMKWAKNRALAEEFIKFTRSAIGQDFFLKAGFIPADSAEGQLLVEKYGVRDA